MASQSSKPTQKCGNCMSADFSPPKDCFGNDLGYGNGLVGCSIKPKRVGYYPFQTTNCEEHRIKE